MRRAKAKSPTEPAGVQKMSNVLPALLAKYGIASTTARQELERAWVAAVGPEVASRSRVGSLRRGVLEILVDDFVLMQELEGYRKGELLKALQEKARQNHIASLRFRKEV